MPPSICFFNAIIFLFHFFFCFDFCLSTPCPISLTDSLHLLVISRAKSTAQAMIKNTRPRYLHLFILMLFSILISIFCEMSWKFHEFPWTSSGYRSNLFTLTLIIFFISNLGMYRGSCHINTSTAF